MRILLCLFEKISRVTQKDIDFLRDLDAGGFRQVGGMGLFCIGARCGGLIHLGLVVLSFRQHYFLRKNIIKCVSDIKNSFHLRLIKM